MSIGEFFILKVHYFRNTIKSSVFIIYYKTSSWLVLRQGTFKLQAFIVKVLQVAPPFLVKVRMLSKRFS